MIKVFKLIKCNTATILGCVWATIIALVFIILIVSTSSNTTLVNGTVSSVRIMTRNSEVKTHDGNVLGEAAMGYMIAGKTGALIGAIDGSNSNVEIIEGGVESCTIKIATDSGDITFTYSDKYSQSVYSCVGMRPGDKVIIKHRIDKQFGRITNKVWTWL